MLWVWRHPRPEGVEGRCIGRSDVRVPTRRAKRLARQIQNHARRHGLAWVVYTSPSQRCALVGRYLRRWGWIHVIDPSLLELNFGDWDGRLWLDISPADIDQWCQNFASHRPGGGEALAELLMRAEAWRPDRGDGGVDEGLQHIVIGHAGWMLARRWGQSHAEPPSQAVQWPAAPAYGTLWRLD
ncbi:MAG: histidine phosphatase family protein [Burkholderiales bacterium]|nr:histidine phosphatase family protein [Burkholderiales bacterium]